MNGLMQSMTRLGAGRLATIAAAGTEPEIAEGRVSFNPVTLARRLLAKPSMEHHLPLKKRGTA